MIAIACVIVLMLICLAGFALGIYLLYKAVKCKSFSDAEAVVTFCLGGLAFSVAGLVGFISETILLLSLLQKM